VDIGKNDGVVAPAVSAAGDGWSRLFTSGSSSWPSS